MDLDLKVQDTMLLKLSTDLSSLDFINPLLPCMPIFLDQAARSQLLKGMPMLDDIDVTARQTSDQSRGIHIPRTDATGGQRVTDASSGKGKEHVLVTGRTVRVGSQSPPRDVWGSSASTAPPERKRRLFQSNGSVVGEPSPSGQQAPKRATTP
jgi:hypothetical protein